ncbi:MAG: TIGR00341 family protein [Candidatus Obscuribacterales bacterium]
MSLDSLPYLENIRIARLFGQSDEAILDLKQRLNEMSQLTMDFVVLLGTSTVIATLGLFQNSAAVIIGAMIIAPLMRPLMGLAYGSLIANAFLIRRSISTIIVGSVVAVFIAFIFATLLQGIEVTSEISSRIHPNLLDMGVAVFAGAAGAYCQTRRELADTLAGVAISVALVPPLGVVGIGLALGQTKIWTGAGLLYATNLVGITFSAIIVFLLMGYGPIKRAGRSLGVSLALLVCLMIPLALSMRELLIEHEMSANIKALLREKTYTFKDVQLSKVEVKRFRKPMLVTATVVSSGAGINANQVRLVQDFLTKETGIPIEFRLRVIPSMVVTAIEVTPEGEQEKTVPVGTPLDNGALDWQDADSEAASPGAPGDAPAAESSPAVPEFESPESEPASEADAEEPAARQPDGQSRIQTQPQTQPQPQPQEDTSGTTAPAAK